MCDYWARIKIRKRSVEELVDLVNETIKDASNPVVHDRSEQIRRFWSSLGVKDMDRLCREEPDLCEKIRDVEEQVKKK